MVHMLVVVGLGWIGWLLLRWVVIVALLVDIAMAEHFFDGQNEWWQSRVVWIWPEWCILSIVENMSRGAFLIMQKSIPMLHIPYFRLFPRIIPRIALDGVLSTGWCVGHSKSHLVLPARNLCCLSTPSTWYIVDGWTVHCMFLTNFQ